MWGRQKHRSPGLAQVLIYERTTNIRFPTLVEGNDFHNYLCLEILSCKEVNMSPAEDRNRFPSIISERFVNQSPKLLLAPRGQQGTGRQGRDRPVTFSASRAWARAGSPSPSPVSHMPPSGAGRSRGGLSPDLSSVHLRVRGPQHPWNPLVPGHPRRESSPLPADQSPPAPATCLRSSSSVPTISYAHLTHRAPNRHLGRHWCPRQSPPSRWG